MVRLAYTWVQPCDQPEDEQGVDVVGELERIELVAGEKGEDAVEAAELVDEEGEGDEFGCCAE